MFFGEHETQAGGPSNLSSRLAQNFPQRLNGSIFSITPNKKLRVEFAAVGKVITVSEMSFLESKILLVEKLEDDVYDDILEKSILTRWTASMIRGLCLKTKAHIKRMKTCIEKRWALKRKSEERNSLRR